LSPTPGHVTLWTRLQKQTKNCSLTDMKNTVLVYKVTKDRNKLGEV